MVAQQFSTRAKQCPAEAEGSFSRLSPKRIAKFYEEGFAGAWHDPEEQSELIELMQFDNYGEAADHFGDFDAGGIDDELAGLCLPYLDVIQAEATRLGIAGTIAELTRNEEIRPWDEAQDGPDCTSHWARNHADSVRAGDIRQRKELEGWHMRCATEIGYGGRGHSGGGSNPGRVARVYHKTAGMYLRKEHDIPGFGKLDLSEYTYALGRDMGRRGIPQPIADYAQDHQIGELVRCDDLDQAIRAFRNGYSIGGGCGYGYVHERDANGVSKRGKGWNHAMWESAMDERPSTIKLYKGRLFLVQNSWWKFNRGPRRIRGTNLYIPHGSFWITERNMKGMIDSGEFYVLGKADGFEPMRLVTLGAAGLI